MDTSRNSSLKAHSNRLSPNYIYVCDAYSGILCSVWLYTRPSLGRPMAHMAIAAVNFLHTQLREAVRAEPHVCYSMH